MADTIGWAGDRQFGGETAGLTPERERELLDRYRAGGFTTV